MSLEGNHSILIIGLKKSSSFQVGKHFSCNINMNGPCKAGLNEAATETTNLISRGKRFPL